MSHLTSGDVREWEDASTTQSEFLVQDFKNSVPRFKQQLLGCVVGFGSCSMIFLLDDGCQAASPLRQLDSLCLFLSCLISSCLLFFHVPRVLQDLTRVRTWSVTVSSTFALLFLLEVCRRVVVDLKVWSSSSCNPPVFLSLDFTDVLSWGRSCQVDVSSADCATSDCEERACVPRMFFPDAFIYYLMLGMFLPVSAGIDAISAIVLCLLELVVLLVVGGAVGVSMFHLWTGTLLHTVSSMMTVLVCSSRIANASEEFHQEASLRRLIDQTDRLLCTLIPRSLHSRLKDQESKEMVGRSMDMCIVMFVSLSPAAPSSSSSSSSSSYMATKDLYDILNAVYGEFDELVDQFGMFKYHHVVDQYVVACPRSAYPFQDPINLEAYARSSARRMVILASKFMEVARKYRTRSGEPLWAKAGVSMGKVAGAVVGQQRRFYCLFGDPVNTAARMCASSEPSKLQATEVFVQTLTSGKEEGISCVCRGVRAVKGKGTMKTFYVELEESWRDRRVSSPLTRSFSSQPDSLARRLLVDPCEHHSRRSRVVREFPERKMREEEEEEEEEEEGKRKVPMKFKEGRRVSSRSSESAGGEGSSSSRMGAWKSFVRDDYQSAMYDRLKFSSSSSFQDAATERQFWSDRRQLEQKKLLVAMVSNLLRILVAFLSICELEGFKRMEGKPAHRLFVLSQKIAIAAMALLLGLCSLRMLRVEEEGAYTQLLLWKRLLTGYNVAYTLLMASSSMAIRATGWMLVFTPCFTFFNLIHTSLSSQEHLLLTLLLLPPALIFPLLEEQVNWTTVFLPLACATFSYVQVKNSLLLERERWRMIQQRKLENRAILRILSDLFPLDVARQILLLGKVPCSTRRAAVLYLDLCNYTELTGSMEALELAKLVHQVFSRFDAAVQTRQLFKMDTIGDAYVCASWMEEEGEREVCQRMVSLASDMVSIVEQVGADFSVPLACRIGIATGSCLAGTVGTLQPRYQLMGQAVDRAHRLESTAPQQGINISEEVGQLLKLQTTGSEVWGRGRKGMVAGGRMVLNAGLTGSDW